MCRRASNNNTLAVAMSEDVRLDRDTRQVEEETAAVDNRHTDYSRRCFDRDSGLRPLVFAHVVSSNNKCSKSGPQFTKFGAHVGESP